MEDSEAVKILIEILEKYPLDEKETEALKEAIGIMSWTKLAEGFNQNRKKARDKKLQDLDTDTL